MSLATIAGAIRERTEPEKVGDISEVMRSINVLLDQSIAADGYRILGTEPGQPDRRALINLADIDFGMLAKRFEKSNRKNVELEQLKAVIRPSLAAWWN